jgi:hypothetical protein
MITTFLDDIQDNRRPQGQRYELRYIVLISIMATLSNAKSYRDIARFINMHFRVLKSDFKLKWKKPPGYTTIRNILKGIDGEELEACFRAYNQSILNKLDDKKIVTIALDGKTLCGSYDNFIDKKPMQILSMFETSDRLILAHEVIDEKTNEIPVIQKLLREIGLDGYYYTMDALHCQKKLLKRQKKDTKTLLSN